MAEPPAGLTVKENRDLVGREARPWTRRLLLLVLATVLVLGLANVFGQRPTTDAVRSPTADVAVKAPVDVRGGLYFEARFTVTATAELRRAALVLDRGWLEGITINTVEPAPIGEASRDGRLVLELGRVPAGDEHVLYLQMQVNPTTVGRRAAGVVLEDDGRELARIDRSLTVWP
jgi:hypothetical protein